MRLFVFANTRSEASLAGLQPSTSLRHGKAFTDIFYLEFAKAEGMAWREGDWIQVHQRLGEQLSEICMDQIVRACTQQHLFLRALDLHTFEVMKWPTSTS